MKTIIFISFIILQTGIVLKTIKNNNKIYKFSINQNNKFNNYESNKYTNDNINFEIIFDIYSRKVNIYKGWITLLNYTRNKINIIKEMKKSEKHNIYTKQTNYELLPDLIKIEKFEDPNFSFKDFSYINIKKNKIRRLKFVNDYPLIKFTFSKNGIINIYRPDNISDLDFYDIVQFLNGIIFKNKELFFDAHNIGEEDNEDNIHDNEEYEYYEKEDNYREGNFSFKNYFKEKLKKNKKFSFILFKRNILGIELVGKINVNLYKNKTGIINLEIYTKKLNNKPKNIFSYDFILSTNEITDILVNELGGLFEYLESFINDINNYISIETIKNIILSFIKINKNFQIKTLFKNPIKFLVFILNEYKIDILIKWDYILKIIVTFLKEYFTNLKDFVIPFIKILFGQMFTSFDFINTFVNFGNMKDYFTSTKDIIFNKLSGTYEEFKNSKNTKMFKDKTGKLFKDGINKIKDISQSKTVNNIKTSCADAVNYVGDKLKDYF